ncbi:MAG: FecR domain-containing protein [Flavobacteriales bacterium]|jgi:transmembrane sensor|nr:MAG: FecR domain-containing protein [Flavobacteriales bacterium]
MDHSGIDSDLLARYITGEADPAQRARVEEWAAASADHAQELERMRRIWGWGAEAEPGPGADVDTAWSKLEQRIAGEEGRGRVMPIGGGGGGLRRWAAAAALAGVLLAGWWLLQPGTQRYVADAAAVDARLTDSSRAVLSPASALAVRMGRQRRVELSGEAYFEVVRDTGRPFVVETDHVVVTVLGTAFEVSAYDTAAVVRVRVRSGRVQVAAAGDTITLAAGQHAVFHKHRHVLERRPAPPAEAWGNRILQFEEASLRQVAEQLQRSYGVRIALRTEAIARCTLTAEFDDEPIERILAVIADTFGLELTGSGREFALDGEGC